MLRFPAAFLAPPRRNTLCMIAAAVLVTGLAGCASTVESVDGETKTSAMTEAPFLGRWTSELDGARLVIELPAARSAGK